MVKNNQNFVLKSFLLLKYQKLLTFLVKNPKKKIVFFFLVLSYGITLRGCSQIMSAENRGGPDPPPLPLPPLSAIVSIPPPSPLCQPLSAFLQPPSPFCQHLLSPPFLLCVSFVNIFYATLFLNNLFFWKKVNYLTKSTNMSW